MPLQSVILDQLQQTFPVLQADTGEEALNGESSADESVVVDSQ